MRGARPWSVEPVTTRLLMQNGAILARSAMLRHGSHGHSTVTRGALRASRPVNHHQRCIGLYRPLAIRGTCKMLLVQSLIATSIAGWPELWTRFNLQSVKMATQMGCSVNGESTAGH